jgi:hypothetical protein
LQPVELGVQAPRAFGVGQQRDPFGGGRERDAVAGQAGADAQGDPEGVLPVPGGPSNTMFSRPARKSSWPRCSTVSRLSEAWKAKSNSSIVLRAGNRAALILLWPPWLSRLSVSVFSSAAANSS